MRKPLHVAFGVAIALTLAMAAAPCALADDGGSGSLEINRCAGHNRWETSALIIDEEISSGSYSGVIVASGKEFADALSASGLSGVLNYPVLLTDPDKLFDDTANALNRLTESNGGKLDIIIVGGEKAVSATVEKSICAYDADGQVTRIEGDTRYETNSKVYEYGAKNGGWNNDVVFVATGEKFPDALAIAPYAAANDAPVILTGGTLTATAQQAVSSSTSTVVLGGDGAVSDAVFQTLTTLNANTSRIAGGDRYKTGAQVVSWELSQGMTLQNAGFATGLNFPDALASGFLLAKTNSVLVLMDPTNTYNAEALKLVQDWAASGAVAEKKLVVFGGDNAIPDEVVKSIATAAGWQSGSGDSGDSGGSGGSDNSPTTGDNELPIIRI